MRSLETRLLAYSGRLLLEYNESTGAICRALSASARAITDAECDVAVTYRGVTITVDGDGSLRIPVRELRYNAALQARVHSILRQVQGRTLDVAQALAQLERVEAETPHHPRWVSVPLLGVAAACLARLLGADSGAVLIAGLSTSLGLVARQELGRRRMNTLALPLVAGFIGALLGGLAFRLDWTNTPALALIVPSLMLIPGAHLINSLLDVVDNYLSMSMARMAFAANIMVATTLGIVLGLALILPELPSSEQAGAEGLGLLGDMLLAGLVTLGFAVFYNTAWQHMGMAVAGGMVGHGVRFLALQQSWGLIPAAFLGGLAVGIVAGMMVRFYQLPLAVVAFAGAVTMMPGVQIYRAARGSLQIARLIEAAELPTIAATLGNALQATYVVCALALGLILGAAAASVRRASG